MTRLGSDEADDPVWQAYLTKEHSVSTLKTWARSLRMFRFCRADRGQGNNGDRLLLNLRFQDASEYDLIAHALDVSVPAFALVAFESQAYNDFTVTYRVAPWHHWTEVCGTPAYLSISGWTFSLQLQSVANIWAVDQDAIDRAKQVEDALEPVRSLTVDPPLNRVECICPRFYPLWFSDPIRPPITLTDDQ